MGRVHDTHAALGDTAADEAQDAFGQGQHDLAGASRGIEDIPVKHEFRAGRYRQRRLVQKDELPGTDLRSGNGFILKNAHAEFEDAWLGIRRGSVNSRVCRGNKTNIDSGRRSNSGAADEGAKNGQRSNVCC